MSGGAPEGIEEVEHLWIPLTDGCRIAARLWLPDDARERPVPAILEYIPYRKRDFTRARDEPIHRYFAMNGYAAIRVDIRGTGDSDGVFRDEYTDQEHQDAVEIVAWLAAQPWCDGKVGMMGISWGGFNALQVAALRPPALGAVISLCSTDDRYADDAHFMGGCLLNENMQWGSVLMATAALPPDPAIVGEVWREAWRSRIESLEAFPALWMDHPWRDEYWRHGSVCENYDAIRCPVYAIGGWADGYSNAVPRLLANLSCPRKGLVGPWAHLFPHDGVPGPAIGFLQEAVRWWDHWLKGRDTGIMDEPTFRAWMQESVPPQPQYEEWPGRWVAEEAWPSARIEPWSLWLNPGHLGEAAGAVTDLPLASPMTTGVRSGEWCAFGAEGEMPRDQRPDDGGSLVFDTDPLPGRVEILGAPEVELELSSDRPVALVCARLEEVREDGSVLRVSYGLLNLCHRDGHAAPRPMEPGRVERLRLRLNDCAHAFPAGHRIRIALSTAYWPIAWPSPERAVVTVRTGTGALRLPVRPPLAEDASLRPFEPPASAPGIAHRKLHFMAARRTIEIDLATNEMVYRLRGDAGELGGAALARIEAIDLDIGYVMTKRYRIIEHDPLSAQTDVRQSTLLRRGDWSVRIECSTRLTATAESFQFTGDLDAYEGDAPFAHRSWTRSVPRKLL